jgi:predicted PurR-regulated permease PerM
LSDGVYVRRVAIAVGFVILATAAFLVAFEAIPVLLLIFLAVLLAVFLRALTGLVGKYTSLRFRWRLVSVVGVILGLVALGGLLLAPNAVSRISGVMQQLPEVRQRLDQYGWSGLLYHIPGMQELLSGNLNIWNRLTKSFSFGETFGPVISIGLVIVIGLYLAAAPEVYVQGIVALSPRSARDACRDVLLQMGETLRWWLIGQAAGMLYIGVLVGFGLKLMGMPLAFSLGVFAGAMAFVPNIGYFLSIAPAILLAVLRAPLTPFYVLLLYTGAHWSNDYVLIPLVQRRVVHLPPALTISAQLLLGYLLGGIGLLVATPLVAILLVLVKIVCLGGGSAARK